MDENLRKILNSTDVRILDTSVNPRPVSGQTLGQTPSVKLWVKLRGQTQGNKFIHCLALGHTPSQI